MMKAVGSSEKAVNICQTTQCYSPKGNRLHDKMKCFEMVETCSTHNE